jgi:hypothetical protein
MVNEEKVWGYVLSFVQDPVEPKLMFLGTEFGLYVSIDAGENWTQWKNGYPTVSTMDLKIHPREHDLVIGTFGRSAWILDDIRPLRALAAEGTDLLDKTIVVIDTPVGVKAQTKSAPGYYFTGDAYYEGENRPTGAMISFYVKEGVKKDENSGASGRVTGNNGTGQTGVNGSGNKNGSVDSLLIKIYNADKQLVRTMKTVPEPGLNRINWRFDSKGLKMPSSGRYSRRGGDNLGGGPPVPPGNYALRFYYKGDSATANLEIIADPREEYDLAGTLDRQKKLEPLVQKLEELAKSMETLQKCKSTMETVNRLATQPQKDSLKTVTKETLKALDPLNEKMFGKENVQGIVDESQQISSKLSGVYGLIWQEEAMTPTQDIVLKQSLEICEEALGEINSFMENEWMKYKNEVEKAGVSIFR